MSPKKTPKKTPQKTSLNKGEDKKNYPGTWRDLAWKNVLIEKPEYVLGFFAPRLLARKDPDKEISVIDNLHLPMGESATDKH
jgi:hypothetical protein